MDILIVSDFCGSFNGSFNSRFTYIANCLSNMGHQVEILTSNFNHDSKLHFELKSYDNIYKVTMINEPGYSKNVCLRRFYSHFVWGLNVAKYLRKRKKPDIIYCAVPTLTAAYAASNYCEKHNVRFIIDIQDLWPEAYKMVFNVPIINSIIFAPFTFLANGIYKRANEIIAVSQTYVDRALKINKKVKNAHSVFLGTNLNDFDNNVKNNPVDESFPIKLPQKNKGELWLAYCGTLGASYDLTCVFDALEILKNKGIKPPKFLVMGDGPRRQDFECYSVIKQLDVFFTGRLAYSQMCALLCCCDIAVNPITKGAAQSIINKHADYSASGLPIINTQECKEYRDLIEDYCMGINCLNSEPKELANSIEKLMKDGPLRLKMSSNSRKCAEDKFNRLNSYKIIYSMMNQ